MIEPSPFDADTAYVTVDAHRLDDMRPYLYKTTDLGKTWKRLDKALTADIYLHSVKEDPKKRGQLYLATERGVMYSTDDGQTWRPLQLNLPTVAVHDLIVKDDNLVLATHGRSLWILDDLQPIREYTKEIDAAPVHLFAPADAVRWRYGDGSYGGRAGSYSNPPQGASIYYSLGSEDKGEVTLEIADAKGTVIRTLSSTAPEPAGSEDNQQKADPALSGKAGVQRAVWDLRYEGANKIRGGKIDTGDPEEGPRVAPGTYTVRLTAAGQTVTAPLRVVSDPRGDASPEDLEAQTALALRVRDDISKVTGLVNQLRSVRSQLKARSTALENRKSDSGIASLIGDSDAAIKKAEALEDKLHNPTAEVVYDILAMHGGTRLYSRLAFLQLSIVQAEAAPTAGMTQVLADEEKELSSLEADTTQFLSNDVSKLNERAAQLNVPFVVVKH
jgi:hypothetical protein